MLFVFTESTCALLQRRQMLLYKLGEMKGKYRLAWNNCEHFAIWCKYGVKKSKQVKKISTYVLMGCCIAIFVLHWLSKFIFC